MDPSRHGPLVKTVDGSSGGEDREKASNMNRSDEVIPVNRDINPTLVDEYIEVLEKIKELQEWKDELREEILKRSKTIPKMHVHGNKFSIKVSTYVRLDIPTRKDTERYERFKELLIDTGVYDLVSSPDKTLLRDMLRSDKIGTFAKARINKMCKTREIKVINKLVGRAV